MRNFILVLSYHRRAAALAQMVVAFELLLDERLGFVRAEVRSAFELLPAQRDEDLGTIGKTGGSARVRTRFEVRCGSDRRRHRENRVQRVYADRCGGSWPKWASAWR